MDKITEKEYRNIAFNRVFTRKKLWIFAALALGSIALFIPLSLLNLPDAAYSALVGCYFAIVAGYYIFNMIKANRHSKSSAALKIKLTKKEIESLAIRRWVRKNWFKLVRYHGLTFVMVIVIMTVVMMNTYDSLKILLITAVGCALFGTMFVYAVDRVFFDKTAQEVKRLYREAYEKGDLT